MAERLLAVEWGIIMTGRAFDKIAEGLNEALAITQGSSKPARLHVPAEIDVWAIRAKTNMAQEQFASPRPNGLDEE